MAMPAVIDLFYVAIGLLVVVIAGFIVRAVRLTNASLTMAARHVNLTNPDVATSVLAQIRGPELRCSRCGGPAFALLGTENRYKCEDCHSTFEGPPHIPGATPQYEPLRPS
jgi:ribosomal protein S27AE